MVIQAHKFFFGGAQRRKNEEAEAEQARALVGERLAGIARSASAPPAAADLEDGPERRDNRRKTVFMEAQIVTADLICIPCDVLDLSADGARIAFTESRDLSSFVTLQFKRSGVTKKARVAWRHKNEVGLAFRAAPKPEKTENDSEPDAETDAD
jgi:hypothetical protein